MSGISAAGMSFLAARKIGRATIERWPVVSATARFSSGSHEAIVFNYVRDGQRVNWKARAIDVKDFTQQKGGEQRLWNLDRVLAGHLDIVFVVEGEMDALALSEAGVPDDSILAFPGGAPAGDGDPKESRRYEHVLKALEAGLAKAKVFVLAGDSDDAGKRLCRDLVALFGGAKCRTVEWPAGIKDANEMLIRKGATDLRRYVYEEQREWPIVGLYRLDEIPDPPAIELWLTGYPDWDRKLKIAATMLSVFTGYPGSGKSHFAQQLWFNIARDYNIRVAMFSAETPAKPYVQRNLRQFYHRKNEWAQSDQERAEADAWIREHFLFIQHPNARPTFDWLMETIEGAVQRFGCRAAVVDPWNKLEADFDPRKMSETQWIGTCLDEMIDAARALDIHLQVIAHPAKPLADKRKMPPTLYDIAGSANWNNRVDQGLCMHRPEVVDSKGERKTEANLYHQKARFEQIGWQCKLPLRLNLSTGCFEAVVDTGAGDAA